MAKGAPLPRRFRALAQALADPDAKARLLEAHCEVAVRLATEMGLPAGVTNALAVAYARWDGRGIPSGVAGEQIPMSMRVAIVARDIELWARETDPATTAEMLRSRRGKAYAPAIVDTALGIGVEELRRFEGDLWGVVLALEPEPWLEVAGLRLHTALEALGDFADLKAPELSGHARRVARLAADAGELAGLDKSEARTLVRAALVHDLGVVAVAASVWRAPRRLSVAEWEQVRLHPLWSERILRRCRGLETVAMAAGRHHERLDGSGYSGGIGDDPGDVAGLLACAEIFDEQSSPRSYRPAYAAASVAARMARLADEGGLRRRDVKAVLGAAGMAAPPVREERPAGLTEREVDVLTLPARGSTNRQAAETLGISPKTVGTHVEHIYLKAGVRSRAAATLFAMQNRLLG